LNNIDEYLLIHHQEEQQEPYKDAFSSFMYGLKAEETRRQWPKRLKKFLDFGIDPKLTIEQQSSIFYEKASKNEKWAYSILKNLSRIKKKELQKEK
jgi:hypothetical protein